LQSPAANHHYVPQFYLRAWATAGASGPRLYRYGFTPNGTFRQRSVAPRRTGSENNLDRIRQEASLLPIDSPDTLETRFYASPEAFKQALEQRLRSSAAGVEFTRKRRLLIFDRSSRASSTCSVTLQH
jgi:hypothetical protein